MSMQLDEHEMQRSISRMRQNTARLNRTVAREIKRRRESITRLERANQLLDNKMVASQNPVDHFSSPAQLAPASQQLSQQIGSQPSVENRYRNLLGSHTEPATQFPISQHNARNGAKQYISYNYSTNIRENNYRNTMSPPVREAGRCPPFSAHHRNNELKVNKLPHPSVPVSLAPKPSGPHRNRHVVPGSSINDASYSYCNCCKKIYRCGSCN